VSDASANPAHASPAAAPFFVGIAAWLLPGLGHLLLKRWARGILFFAIVAALALTGYRLRGIVFSIYPPVDPRIDPLAFLGGIGDAGSGVFYFLSRMLEPLGSDVSRAAGDYGTRFLAAAGVANFLCVVDACEIALGRKP
jgi:hypothetical protein